MKKTTMIKVLFTALLMFNLYASQPIEAMNALGDDSTCIIPTYLSKSGVSKSNTIVLGWDLISPAPKMYELIVVPRGETPMASNSVFKRFSYSNSINISGLDSSKPFDAYVRSVCDASSGLVSSWSEKIEFRTHNTGDAEDYPIENEESTKSDPTKILDNSLRIYPNPATTKFKIQGLDVNRIELYNILGSKVLDVRNTNSADVSHLKNGAYLVKISGKDTSVTKKLIITQ